MPNIKFDEIDVLLIDHDINVRQSLKNILHDRGFRAIRFGSSLNDIATEVKEAMPDLLISEAVLPDGELAEWVFSLRHSETGDDPFLPVIALTWEPTLELVTSVIESGVDSLITKPITTGDFVKRLKQLVLARKQFIVTSEYIGPVRRKEAVDDAEADLVDAPNRLRAKATGQPLGDIVMQKAIEEINLRKMERHAEQLGILVEATAPKLEAMQWDDDVEADVAQLLYVAYDIARRMGGTKYDHVSGLCQSMTTVCNRIANSEGLPDEKDVKLLRPMGKSIWKGFFATDDEARETARQISDTIGNK